MESGPASIGEQIRGYVLERILGKGGMGCVYLANHEHLRRKVAIKVLDGALTDDQHFISRFFDEAKIVNNVNHANIVDIIDFVQTENPKRVAYIMEFVDGPPLNNALKKHQFTPIQTINICRQIGSALAAVHAINVVHRDLKPANVLLMESPDESDYSTFPSIKVVDFGIAKVAGGSIEHKTSTGALLGTPAYMSPEQVASDPVSSKTDVYALGEIFFELITGRPPFQGENLAILRQKLANVPPELEMPADIPCRKEILGLVRNCLIPDPKSRPELQEVLDGLNFIHGKLEAKPPQTASAPTNPDLRTITERPNSVISPRRLNPIQKWLRQPRRPVHPYTGFVVGFFVFTLSGLLGLFLYKNYSKPRLTSATRIETKAPPDPRPSSSRTKTATIVTESSVPTSPDESRVNPKKDTKRKTNGSKKRKGNRNLSTRQARAFGQLRVEAWTTGGRQISAKIAIDGREVPKSTPLSVRARPGKRKITVRAPGYPPVSQFETVVANKKSTVQVIVDL